MSTKLCTVNRVGRALAGFGLVLLFAGLMDHYNDTIKPAIPLLVYASSALNQMSNFNYGSANGVGNRKWVAGPGGVGSPPWMAGPGGDENPALISESAGVNNPPLISESAGVNNPAWISESAGPNNPPWMAGPVGFHPSKGGVQWSGSEGGFMIAASGFGGATSYETTAFMVMRVDISNSDLGLMISGLVIFVLAAAGLVGVNRKDPEMPIYLGLAVSVFLMCFMYFVTKLSIDGLNNWNLTDVQVALFLPMSIMFVCMLASSVFLAQILIENSPKSQLSIAATISLILAMILGCLFFPVGVVGANSDTNFDAGIGLLAGSFALGCIGAGLAVLANWSSYEKPPAPVVRVDV